ncbi:hypothetical protein Y032_0125g1272 [Ancylostoma ceylanicum]|uniref:Glycogen debranching enzyme C-terminal domain-containing protein n=1 Tax=Ancylostoma ceylanicum TaxID=53326 RepID=A0A016T8W2_9BILA|nr:hypothetical protein Y032_0125g1272 [Ancylostoma ceylanicum]
MQASIRLFMESMVRRRKKTSCGSFPLVIVLETWAKKLEMILRVFSLFKSENFSSDQRASSMRRTLKNSRARYNCRDAVWFWLYAIQSYVRQAPNGHEILKSNVRRIYPKDDTVFGQYAEDEPLIDVMCEALERHFEGIEFRERNAGPQIDEHMRDEGFNVKVYVDRNTGFIHGGNRWNCGTWMDKMGSSEKVGVVTKLYSIFLPPLLRRFSNRRKFSDSRCFH